MPDRFTHSPSNPAVNSTVSCTFGNTALANEEIEVEILVDLVPFRTEIVKLDAYGFGSFAFTVPGCDTILLQQATSADHAIVVA